MSRAEHMAWAKKRAIECGDRGDVTEAFASMTSDLGKHDETRDHLGLNLGLMQMLGGMLSTPAAMNNFIEGFN